MIRYIFPHTQYTALGRDDAIDQYLRYYCPDLNITTQLAASQVELLSYCECSECTPSFKNHPITSKHILSTNFVCIKGRKYRKYKVDPKHIRKSGGSYSCEGQRYSWDSAFDMYKNGKSTTWKFGNNNLHSALQMATRKRLVDGIIHHRKPFFHLNSRGYLAMQNELDEAISALDKKGKRIQNKTQLTRDDQNILYELSQVKYDRQLLLEIIEKRFPVVAQ
jgi:hypothetical protein